MSQISGSCIKSYCITTNRGLQISQLYAQVSLAVYLELTLDFAGWK
jgi:hypothetical protein